MKLKKITWYLYPILNLIFSLFCGVTLRKHYIIKATLSEIQFNVDSKRQIFWEIFHSNFYLLSELLPELSPNKYFSYFVLLPDLAYEPGLYV